MARELAEDADALVRFDREAKITSGLGHPHIVQVFDFGTTPTGESFLVMEFLEGEDLEHRLRRCGRMPGADMLLIVKQVASALAATHAKTIVHRDLKPANIYLLKVAGATDFVKVLDFGISKVRAVTTKFTRAMAVLGTPNYMSPEQALGKIDEIDERTDQWALACIAWECLSGRAPFVGENSDSILYQVVHEAPPSLMSRGAGVNPQVEDVLLRALAKDQKDRFANVNDFALALEAAVAKSASLPIVPQTMQLSEANVSRTRRLPDAIPSPTTFSQTAGELTEPVPRRSQWSWTLTAGAVVLLLLGAFLLFRPRPAPTPVVAGPPPLTPIAPVAPVMPAPSPPTPEPPAVEPVEKPVTKAATAEVAPDPKPRRPISVKRRRVPKPGGENQEQWRLD
jgi:serine/threonine-protein kinase